MNDLVSVVIPAYNMGRWIAETIDSIKRQTYRPLEIVVVDDGSQDDTYAVAEAALRDFDGPVKFIRQENRGLPATRNVGAAASSGNWIHFMDADDLLAPNMIEVLRGTATRCPDAAVVYGSYQRFETRAGVRQLCGPVVNPDVDDSAPASLLHNVVIVPASLVQRTWFERIAGFDATLRFVAEDRDFVIRMALAGGRFVPASYPTALYLYRMFPEKPRVGGANARYRASHSFAVWIASLKRCVANGTLYDLHLRPGDEAGIVANTRKLLWLILLDGHIEEFNQAVLAARCLIPDLVPQWPMLRRLLAKVLPYETAARLESAVRRRLVRYI